MAEVAITIKNLDQIKSAFRRSPERMRKELNTAIAKSMFVIQGETIINVHPDRGINVITGGLLSATERPPELSNLKGVYDVNIKYAVFVHEGTRFMKARPFLQKAVTSKQPEIDKFFTQAVDTVLSQIARDTK